MVTANPEITKIKNEHIDFILMGCDGIWESRSSVDTGKWVRTRLLERKPLGRIIEQMFD